MAVKIKNIVPWGRSLSEYIKFFKLSDDDLNKNILSVADGPSSFNAEMTMKGKKCISFDPIYEFNAEKIQGRIDETCEIIKNEVISNKDNFIWNEYKNPDELIEIRMKAMRLFINDYENDKSKTRYIPGMLPRLPFNKNEFDLVICSHFLFLYTTHFSEENHLESVINMLKVGKEVRIFPLLDLDAKKSDHLMPVIELMKKNNYTCSIEKVPYEFQPGGNKMLRITKLIANEC